MSLIATITTAIRDRVVFMHYSHRREVITLDDVSKELISFQRAGNFIQQTRRYPADKVYWLGYILPTGEQFIHWIEFSAL